jgi:hypothetical protein
MIVRHSKVPVTRCRKASHQPQNTNQITLAMAAQLDCTVVG